MLERNALKNAIVIFDGDVAAEELMELIPREFDGDIVIHGDLIVDVVNFDITGNLWIDGDIWAAASELSIYGSIVCKNIIAYAVTVYDYIEAYQCKVQENLLVHTNCYVDCITANTVKVKGDVHATEIEGDVLEVDGDIIASEISFYNIKANKSICCNIIMSLGKVEVNGSVYAEVDLRVCDMVVNGNVIMHNGYAKCDFLTCSGSIESNTEINASKIIADELYGCYVYVTHIEVTKIKAVIITAHDIKATDYVFADEIEAHDIVSNNIMCDSLNCHKVTKS